jgi:hypothetical protein
MQRPNRTAEMNMYLTILTSKEGMCLHFSLGLSSVKTVSKLEKDSRNNEPDYLSGSAPTLPTSEPRASFPIPALQSSSGFFLYLSGSLWWNAFGTSSVCGLGIIRGHKSKKDERLNEQIDKESPKTLGLYFANHPITGLQKQKRATPTTEQEHQRHCLLENVNQVWNRRHLFDQQKTRSKWPRKSKSDYRREWRKLH